MEDQTIEKGIKYLIYICIVGFLIHSAVGNFTASKTDRDMESTFPQTELDSYLDIYNADIPTKNSYINGSSEHLAIIGKAVAVEVPHEGGDGIEDTNHESLTKCKISEINGLLKNEGIPIAENPSEVNTIITFDHYNELYGRYTGGTAGYIKHLNVKFFNKKTGRRITDENFPFTGSNPPSSKPHTVLDSDSFGSDPDDDAIKLIKYLAQVPGNLDETSYSVYYNGTYNSLLHPECVVTYDTKNTTVMKIVHLKQMKKSDIN